MLKFHMKSKNPPLCPWQVPNISASEIKAAVFCNARDEENIKEWAAHHLLLGFDLVIIFDHKSKKPLKLVFENFDPRVVILDGSFLELKVKVSFMNWAIQVARKLKVSHFIYLDADEFFVLQKGFHHIHKFIESFPVSSIGVNWLLFGSNHQKENPKDKTQLLIETYTKSDEKLNHHVKTLVKTSCVYESKNPHYFDLFLDFCYYGFSNTGDIIKLKSPFWRNPYVTNIEAPPAFIAHYLIQSEESYKKRKLDLPMDDTGGKRSIEDIQSIHKDHNNINCFILKDSYSKSIKELLFFN